jgi:hypothetical protein
MLGRGGEDERSTHVAPPLSSLRDPSTFAPPPKRVDRGGILPPPTPQQHAATSSQGAAPSYSAQGYSSHQQQVEDEEEPPPPKPYRVDTTGLSTAHLPRPPGRRDGADGRTPSPVSQSSTPRTGPPSLPPRLPPRTTTAPSPSPPPPARPPATVAQSHDGYLNQGAMNRLGAAGVSVPALGIGKPESPSPPLPARPTGPSSPPPPKQQRFPGMQTSNAQLSELQSRFSRMGGPSKDVAATPSPPPSEGTTWAQKRAALQTATDLHKDPRSVSVSDARSAASTLNNFRQRHGEQVAAGVQSANSLNYKYGVTSRLGSYAREDAPSAVPSPTEAPTAPSPVSSAGGVLGKKKPPPPPPKKKPGLQSPTKMSPAPGGGEDAPPPVPMSTRPQF